MQTTQKVQIIKMILDMEQHLSKPIWQSQTTIKKNATMAFCNEKEQLYVETDVLGADLALGVGLL